MRIEDLEALAKARTAGKWYSNNDPTGQGFNYGVCVPGEWLNFVETISGYYSTFIAAAANHIDALLAVARAAEKCLGELLAANQGDHILCPADSAPELSEALAALEAK